MTFAEFERLFFAARSLKDEHCQYWLANGGNVYVEFRSVPYGGNGFAYAVEIEIRERSSTGICDGASERWSETKTGSREIKVCKNWDEVLNLLKKTLVGDLWCKAHRLC